MATMLMSVAVLGMLCPLSALVAKEFFTVFCLLKPQYFQIPDYHNQGCSNGGGLYIPPNQCTLNFLCGCFVSLTQDKFNIVQFIPTKIKFLATPLITIQSVIHVIHDNTCIMHWNVWTTCSENQFWGHLSLTPAHWLFAAKTTSSQDATTPWLNVLIIIFF